MKISLLVPALGLVGLGHFSGLAQQAVRLDIGNGVALLRIARTSAQMQKGLSGREVLGENEGMVFRVAEGAPPVFHMEGVKMPLSIAFLNIEGEVLEITDMEPESGRRYAAPPRTRYAIEMNQGWFEKHGVSAGTPIAGLIYEA